MLIEIGKFVKVFHVKLLQIRHIAVQQILKLYIERYKVTDDVTLPVLSLLRMACSLSLSHARICLSVVSTLATSSLNLSLIAKVLLYNLNLRAA